MKKSSIILAALMGVFAITSCNKDIAPEGGSNVEVDQF